MHGIYLGVTLSEQLAAIVVRGLLLSDPPAERRDYLGGPRRSAAGISAYYSTVGL